MATTAGVDAAVACRHNSNANDSSRASASSTSVFFESSNISSSTTFDSETLTEEQDSVCQSPVIENSNLGQLSRKQSPLNQLVKADQSKLSYSIRTEVPLYVRKLFLAEPKGKTTQLRMRQRKGKGTGAMNTTGTGNSPQNVLDMNRNNGFFQNGTIMTTANAEKREHLYKILVIGELGTGKTSFIKRYVHQFFSQNYRATIGVDFALKVLHWDPNTIVRLQLWDIAGQERFGNMTRVYYKEAVGAFIVFDVTRSGTFECVSKWKEDLDSKVQLPDGSPIPCILLANKCDQEKQGIVTQTEKMDEYVKENGFSGWFETSAKENTNIDEAARALVSKILLNDKLISAADLADSEKFNLNNAADQADLESKKCSC